MRPTSSGAWTTQGNFHFQAPELGDGEKWIKKGGEEVDCTSRHPNPTPTCSSTSLSRHSCELRRGWVYYTGRSSWQNARPSCTAAPLCSSVCGRYICSNITETLYYGVEYKTVGWTNSTAFLVFATNAGLMYNNAHTRNMVEVRGESAHGPTPGAWTPMDDPPRTLSEFEHRKWWAPHLVNCRKWCVAAFVNKDRLDRLRMIRRSSFFWSYDQGNITSSAPDQVHRLR